MYPHQTPDLKEIDSELICCFDYNDQDYTLHPGSDFFTTSLDEKAYVSRLNSRSIGSNRRLRSLYIHLPFCSQLCPYCNADSPRHGNNGLLDKYIDYLISEIGLLGKLLQNAPRVEQIYLRGGTPAFLEQTQLSRLMNKIKKNFHLTHEGVFRATIDPLLCNISSFKFFRETGINHLTIVAQDFDQQINLTTCHKRAETGNEIKTLDVIHAAQETGFNTIKIELLYGLSKQSKQKFARTLDKIIAANPNLINLRSHKPRAEEFAMHKANQRIELLSIRDKLDLKLDAINHLMSRGYIHIGMNLFARPDDPLVTAQQQGRLYYDLQGFSIYPDSDFIPLGVSAIGKSGSVFFQNYCDLVHYYAQLDRNKLPVMRGLELNLDDILRRSVIHALICHSVVSFEAIETYFSTSFKHYFANELIKLTAHEKAGLVTINDEEITITPKGRLFVGGICKVFDKYLQTNTTCRLLPTEQN